MRGTNAAIYRGELAIRAGLADRVGTLDLAIAEMVAELDRAASAPRTTVNPIPKRSPSMATNETEQVRHEADELPPAAASAGSSAAVRARSSAGASVDCPCLRAAPEPTAADALRAEYAEIAEIAAQAARLGVTVDAADAMRKGDLRRCAAPFRARHAGRARRGNERHRGGTVHADRRRQPDRAPRQGARRGGPHLIH